MNKNLEKESFYTSPPYDYRPSIAEYLTTFNVTKNGFLADILHLDKKKNLKITFEKDFLKIKLITDKNIDTTELIIWNYLKSLEKNNEITLNPYKIPKSILKQHYLSVIFKTYQKFGTIFQKNYTLEPDPNANYGSITTSRIAVGIFFLVINAIFGGVWLIMLILGIVKVYSEKDDTKQLLKKFLLKYFLVSLGMFAIGGLFILILYLIEKTNIELLKTLLPIIFILSIIIIFYLYCRILYDYVCWLFESKEASKNRREWINFRSFVITRSEIEKSPIAHYILWGPFYYYTLAVGGMKRPSIR